MTERTFEVYTIGVDYICDKCEGVMEQTGFMIHADPPKWRHKCNKCGEVVDLLEKYPTVRFKPTK
jgi:DNA-directed RNA polymerase subunit RPC12/RpoP